jgi:glycosyltransferase involved in cell wall biosynthesis
LPRSVLDTENAEMRALIARCAESSPYDAVLASEVDMAQYIRPLPGLKVLEEVELAALYEQTRRETHPIRRARKLLMWQKWAAYLRAVAGNVAGATVVSEPERALLQRTLGQRKIPLRVIPNGVDLARYQGDFGAPVENTLIFPGALTYSANFDAMIFFLGQVFPLIRAEIPEVRLSITGGHSGIPVERLPSQPGVTLTGYLGDIRPALAQSWACVTPLGIGGGTRLKILEALALGTPVISTSKGAEGLEISPGREVLIADEPHEFAAQVVRVLRDASLRQRLADNGRAAVRAYHWAEIVASYEQFLDELRATV